MGGGHALAKTENLVTHLWFRVTVLALPLHGPYDYRFPPDVETFGWDV